MRHCNLTPVCVILFCFGWSLCYKDFCVSPFSFISSHAHRRRFPSVLCSMACELIYWSGTMSPQAGLFNDKLCCCLRFAHRDVCWKHKGTAVEIGFVSISSILTSFAVPLQGLRGAELETVWNSEMGQWPWPCSTQRVWVHTFFLNKICSFSRIIGEYVGGWLVARETDLVLEWSLFF